MNPDKKAWLLTGRIKVKYADSSQLQAVVQGRNGIYQTVIWKDGWACSCPARKECYHAKALRTIWAPDLKKVS